MFDPGSPEIAEKLCDMLIYKRFACLQFYDQLLLDKEVGKEIPEVGSILIVNSKRMLLENTEPRFLQSVSQPILINFFCMTVPVVGVEGEVKWSPFRGQHFVGFIDAFGGSSRDLVVVLVS